VLYFPAFWWHQVTSPEQTISVNTFFGDFGQCSFIEKLLVSPQRTSLMYWIYNIVQQNIAYPSFERVLVCLKDSLRNFLFKQWHESLNDKQLDELYESIVEHFQVIGDKIKKNSSPILLNGSDGGGEQPSKSKNPPALKIRGLLMRPNNNNNDELSD
jgi:hypothetical protein